MHFENALLEMFHYHPVAMWLLVASVPMCLVGMWWNLKKLDSVKGKENDILTYVLNETWNSDDGTFTYKIGKETE